MPRAPTAVWADRPTSHTRPADAPVVVQNRSRCHLVILLGRGSLDCGWFAARKVFHVRGDTNQFVRPQRDPDQPSGAIAQYSIPAMLRRGAKAGVRANNRPSNFDPDMVPFINGFVLSRYTEHIHIFDVIDSFH